MAIGDTTITLVGPASSDTGSITVTGQLTGIDDSGGTVPLASRTVTIVSDGNSIAVATTGVDGKFSVTIQLLEGSHSLYARFMGDSTVATETWDALCQPSAPTLITPRLFQDNSFAYAAGSGASFYLSPDSGADWNLAKYQSFYLISAASDRLNNDLWVGGRDPSVTPNQWGVRQYRAGIGEVSRLDITYEAGSPMTRIFRIMTLASGGILVIGCLTSTNELEWTAYPTYLRFTYRTPSGVWMPTIGVDLVGEGGNISSIIISSCQHPADGGIFVFFKRDSYHEIGCAHLTEHSDGVMIDWAVPNFIDRHDGLDEPEGELPCLDSVAYEGDILLGYQNKQYKIFTTTPTFCKGANISFVKVKPDGTWQPYTRLLEWVERISNFSITTLSRGGFVVGWMSGSNTDFRYGYTSQFDGSSWSILQPVGGKVQFLGGHDRMVYKSTTVTYRFTRMRYS